jgi:hypothetical protein
LENQKLLLFFIHNDASFHSFIFFISVIGVPIFSILDSIESFCKEV